MDCHHVGAPAQHDMVHACVIKIKGVARQCIKHSKLVIDPILSGLSIIEFHIKIFYLLILQI